MTTSLRLAKDLKRPVRPIVENLCVVTVYTTSPKDRIKDRILCPFRPVVGNLCVVTVYTMSPRDSTPCTISSHTPHPPATQVTRSHKEALTCTAETVPTRRQVPKRNHRMVPVSMPPVRPTMFVTNSSTRTPKVHCASVSSVPRN